MNIFFVVFYVEYIYFFSLNHHFSKNVNSAIENVKYQTHNPFEIFEGGLFKMDKIIQQLYEQFEQRLIQAIINSLQEKLTIPTERVTEETSEWMDLKTAAKYIGVSPNTFNNLRVRGLKVVEIDNVKRVSKTELEKFMKKHAI